MRLRPRSEGHIKAMNVRRTDSRSALVLVDNRRIVTQVRGKPAIGAQLDVGFPVVVVQTKDVAGGGLIVQARRDGAVD